MKTRLTALILAALSLWQLTGCALRPGGREQAAPARGETRIFVDDCGREVEIPEHITSFAASGSLAQIVLISLAPELFSGLASRMDEPARGYLPEELFSLEYIGKLDNGADMNLEQLAAAAPDVIIDIGERKEDTPGQLDRLEEQTTIPAVFLSSSLETMPETFLKLGELLDREEKAGELAAFCRRTYERSCAVVRAVGEENRAKVLYITGEKGLNVLARSSYHAQVLDLLADNLAVVDNPASKGSGNEVSMDQLLLWAPEFIVFSPESIYSDVGDMELWKAIPAIADGNYIETPSAPYNWMGSPPSAQRYLGMLWLTAALYPDFCDYDVKAEIKEYFRLFYGCTLSDAQYEALTANAFVPQA